MEMLDLLIHSLPRAVAWSVAVLVGYFGYRWYTVRMMFRRLKAQGLPMMPHSLIWGHMRAIEVLPDEEVPPDLYTSDIGWRITKNWKLLFPDEEICPHVVYLDFWPISTPIMLVTDPAVATQYMQHPSAPKADDLRPFIYPLTRCLDLLSMENQTWKTWRARFNPGFSARNVMAQLPQLLEEVELFVDIIKSKAGKDGEWGKVFEMEKYTTNLTYDVIGRSSFGVSFQTQQHEESGMREALVKVSRLLIYDVNIFTIWRIMNPIRRYRIWKSQQVMDSILLPHIEKELGREKDGGEFKTILGLAVKDARGNIGDGGERAKLDGEFVETVLSQMKLFLFAGHDTTATSACWALYLLQKHPECLEKMRREHDEVFGPNSRDAGRLLRENPALINSVPYTLCVLKESLRLYPNLAPARQGGKTLNITNVPGHEGKVFPSDGFFLWDGHRSMHLRDDLWPRAQDFLPERWMAPEGDPMHPPKDGFRTFSVGPRNCIGKDLAMLELKLLLVMLSREVDWEEAWEAWDQEKGRTEKPWTYEGDRLYQVNSITPHPKDGMPIHVRLLKDRQTVR